MKSFFAPTYSIRCGVFIAALSVLLVLAGCKNLFEPPDMVNPATVGENGGGTFSLNIGGVQTARTILPAAVQDDFAAYTLIFSAGEKANITAERTKTTLDEAVALPVGTWNLTVTAFMDSGRTEPVARGTLEGIRINSGENTSGNLQLTAIIEAGTTGTFRWSIEYPEQVTSAGMTIIPLDEETGTEEKTWWFTGDEPSNKSDTITLNTGYYRVVFSLKKGTIEAGREDYLHIYQNMESAFTCTFTEDYFTVISVVSGEDTNVPGTLRYAIANTPANGTIVIEQSVGTIRLTGSLSIDKSLNIRGNGVTITRAESWITVDDNSQLLRLYTQSLSSGTVNISRIHFKDGRTTGNGAAIYNSVYYNSNGTVNLESCIFSGNQANSSMFSHGGAIYNRYGGTMSVKGCTFYNNSATGSGAAIYNYDGAALTLAGNLFYGNINKSYPSYPAVASGSPVNSAGYNVVDLPLGTDTYRSGWTARTGDKTISGWPMSPVTFKPLSGSEAAGVITTLPPGYPAKDFYGNDISDGAAAGAVQDTVSGHGYIPTLSVNNSALGSVSLSCVFDTDGLVSGPMSIGAAAETGAGAFFDYWLINGVKTDSDNPLIHTMTGHTTIQAVFSKVILVTDFTDTAGSATTEGTLRYALTNAQDGYIIRMSGVTAGVTTIELTSASPTITKSITIEGNGVTLTHAASWTPANDSSLLGIFNSNNDVMVNISRVHFKDSRASGRAVYAYDINSNIYGSMVIRLRINLESCIFSGNRASGDGGAIYNQGTMSVKGCTFYNNSATGNGAAIYNETYATLTLAGNLFYENISTAQYPGLVYNRNGNSATTSAGYNVSENYGGWTPKAGDKTITTWPISPVTFKVLPDSGAANIIGTLPSGYPAKDFYGEDITSGASAGAVQGKVNGGGYVLALSVNNSALGSVSLPDGFDADGLVSGSASLTAAAEAGASLEYWLVNGVKAGSNNPFNCPITGHTAIQAVFGKVVQVTNFTDAVGSATTEGTLRYALTNAQGGDIIRFSGVTAGTTTIALTSALPAITKSITIEGNGITVSGNYKLLNITGSSLTVNISRIHFKDGRTTGTGAAINTDNYGGFYGGSKATVVNVELCIFSGNQAGMGGGAIHNFTGTMNVKGCTFYNNSTTGSSGAAIRNTNGGTLILAGNLFYGNTTSTGFQKVVYNDGGGGFAKPVVSVGYNVVDVPLGTAPTQSGWTAVTGDTTFTTLGINGVPFNTTTFAPVDGLKIILSAPADFPLVDFYGNTRTWPGAPGAVSP